MNFISNSILALSAAVVGAALTWCMFSTYSPAPSIADSIQRTSYHSNTISQVPANTVTASFVPPASFETAASKSVDAVVHVKTSAQKSMSLPPWLELFGYSAPQGIEHGSGSGVIIDKSGYIVTNNHVVEGASEIIVSMNNNHAYPAKIVGTDSATDLAVLKIDTEEALPCLPFGDSDALQVGEWVLAVGNPFELTSTVTAGIVSAKARNINLMRSNPYLNDYPIESFIQTDAAVNPGNSGGALVNTAGELVGINTAIASRTGSYAGYSFAIPSSIAQKVTHDLLLHGEVLRAFLGITIEPVTEEFAKKMGMSEIRGCAITAVLTDGAADQAGLEQNDVLIAIDDQPISSFPELQEVMSKHYPGDQILVKVWRDHKAIEIPLILTNRYGSSSPEENDSEAQWIGSCQARVQIISAAQKKALGLKHGVEIISTNGGPFSDAGIRTGFIITHMNGNEMWTLQDIDEQMNGPVGGVLVEGIYPNGRRAYYGVARK